MNSMRFFIFILLLLPTTSLAYNPIVAEPAAVYEPISIEGDVFVEHNLLGDLEGAPDLYEFSSDVAFTFQAQLKQKAGGEYPFALILVRQNDTDDGVIEIARQGARLEDWTTEHYLSLGMALSEAPVLERELTPGTYRLEVSTPDNEGAYMLVTGEETVRSGWWAKFTAVFITQMHFGVFPLLAVLSPYVAIPVLLLLTLALWLKRKWHSVKL